MYVYIRRYSYPNQHMCFLSWFLIILLIYWLSWLHVITLINELVVIATCNPGNVLVAPVYYTYVDKLVAMVSINHQQCIVDLDIVKTFFIISFI